MCVRPQHGSPESRRCFRGRTDDSRVHRCTRRSRPRLCSNVVGSCAPKWCGLVVASQRARSPVGGLTTMKNPRRRDPVTSASLAGRTNLIDAQRWYSKLCCRDRSAWTAQRGRNRNSSRVFGTGSSGDAAPRHSQGERALPGDEAAAHGASVADGGGVRCPTAAATRAVVRSGKCGDGRPAATRLRQPLSGCGTRSRRARRRRARPCPRYRRTTGIRGVGRFARGSGCGRK